MLTEIMTILGLITNALQGIFGGNKAVNLSQLAIAIAQAANRMHVAQEGKPIDPSVLTPEQPLN